MCQYVGTEQFMGAVAYSFAQKKRNCVSLSDLNKIFTIVENDIRNSVDAVLCLSGADVFSVIQSYESCYSLKGESISFKGTEDLYDSYFLAGMQKSVREALESAVCKSILEQ